MMDKTYILQLIKKLSDRLDIEIRNEHYENALEIISICAKILYQTNIYYVDKKLERKLHEISGRIGLTPVFGEKCDTVLFYDGFGLNDRGLVQIYLKGLCTIKKVVYVTYEDCKDQIPDVLRILNEYKGNVKFINRRKKGFLSQIRSLSEIVNEVKPESFFFYSIPNDVVGTMVMNAYEDKLTRYQINLTDHAFWLGAECIDKCIEFRDYGASISEKYRAIPKSKIVKLPFYPMLHKERAFQGYPFEINKSQKMFFSGGALYKTLGGDNKYYDIVKHILEKYDDVVFWYAGSGNDTELKKILSLYPSRAFYTSERADLFQILNESRFYLSTYPVCGGLMYQYAACAGRVPVTLRYDECADGFLLKQDQLDIEFSDVEHLYLEVDKLLCDEEYFEKRKKQMLEAVITEERFTEVLKAILNGNVENDIKYIDINTEDFRQEYLKRLDERDVDAMLIDRSCYKVGIKYAPIHFLRGNWRKAQTKLF